MMIRSTKTECYCGLKGREISAEINSQNTEPVGGPIHGRGVILISFLDTVFSNIWRIHLDYNRTSDGFMLIL